MFKRKTHQLLSKEKNIMAAQTFNIKTIHIIDDLDHKALVIENACTKQEADNLEIGSWGKNGCTITVDPQEGFYNLVLKVGGSINAEDALAFHGFKFADEDKTMVEKM